ncbi:MAG: CoB--CoM heterodisulfide reductase iron-sulfur subunit B family protein [Ignavibacteriales bacterium]|nr:CoB--CoM heterodisulfide reductase iron-sulfur subunit B family protein [Ignavibacteriales bacterium]
MKYAYYPGCSLEKTQRGYDESVREVFRTLDQEIVEIEDWNCCGATVYMSVKETVSLAISSRNLALAEQMGLQIMAPCSSCFTVLSKTNRILNEIPALHSDVNEALAEAGLNYSGKTKVRHPLDILMNDIGMVAIQKKMKRDLNGLKIAPYYGCQIVRPDKTFDDKENPILMDRLFRKCGAEVVYFPMKVRCCGGMLMTTFEDTALKLNKELLECAVANEADAIVTTCPLCHFNLEAYQSKINEVYNAKFSVPILYFTQLLGIVFGIQQEAIGLDSSFIPLGDKITSLVTI